MKHSCDGLPEKQIRSSELVVHSLNTKISKCEVYKTHKLPKRPITGHAKTPVCHCIIEPSERLSTLRYSTWTFPRLRQFSNLVIRSPAQPYVYALSVHASQAIYDGPVRVIEHFCLSVCLSTDRDRSDMTQSSFEISVHTLHNNINTLKRY